MIILGMDTSSVNATVAVMNDNKLVAEYLISNDRTHSVIIMPLLEDMLKKCADIFE
jgi:tRNA threonylcarbamoyladenosine biosynthesis protein TsaB